MLESYYLNHISQSFNSIKNSPYTYMPYGIPRKSDETIEIQVKVNIMKYSIQLEGIIFALSFQISQNLETLGSELVIVDRSLNNLNWPLLLAVFLL